MRNGRNRLSPDRGPSMDTLLEVGRVVAVHGVTGKIRVKAASGDPSGLLGAHTLRMRGKPDRGGAEGRDFEVDAAQRAGGCAVFALKGIDTVEAASGLVGSRVFVRRGELPPPEKDEYFVADLIGCEVTASDGILIGHVAGVVNGPAHDWLEIRCSGGGEALLPAVSEFIRDVDVARRRIVASPPEGWLDAR
ncbi:MAG: 16S rRNA processing protein RimM [Deltaproteobacteria bacterium]|nr:16S rRNA processing protein RimM [Deltaproteobacteria bacterium]